MTTTNHNPTPSPVEAIKSSSKGLRGTLAESLADAHTAGVREDDGQLIKLHGIYQQDDRELREERRRRKLEPAISFMIRVRLPGGVCTPAQWLAMDALADRYGNGTLKLTTRQTFELQGVIKEDLAATLQAMDRALLDSIAACGDVNRNVLCSAQPEHSRLHAQVHQCSVALSEHLLPKTQAYHEIFLGRERVAGGEPEHEPLYGPTYLPRKFKTVIAVPPYNDVDLYAHDLGFIAIADGDQLRGFNLAVGGGMGTSHGEPETFPRLADVIGFLPPERLLEVAETVVAIQRDFGDRSNRKHARLKYTIADRGVEWFNAELASRLGEELAPPAPFTFLHQGDRFGWQQASDGRWQLTVRIEGGRVQDLDGINARSGLRALAEIHPGRLRITPNQNLVIADIEPEHRERVDQLLKAHGVLDSLAWSPLRRDALACVALPLCPLAMAEGERWLPALGQQIDQLLGKHRLANEALSLRITGCPNGCARPYVAEIALIGKAPGLYNLLLGGDRVGQRLNALYRESVNEAALLAELDALFARWAGERQPGEAFGDFTRRVGLVHGFSPHPIKEAA